MKELHLFVLWPNALEHKDSLEAMIKSEFNIVSSGSIVRSDEYAFDNFLRFYGKSKKIITHKLSHCGFGKSHFFVIEDNAPRYESTMTSSGVASVNRHVFDFKLKLRASIGGGHTIHGTNSVEEFNKDITFLAGEAGVTLIETQDGASFPNHFGDPVGVNGWPGLKSFLEILPYHSDYVVLRNFSTLPHTAPEGSHQDIDFLVDDIKSAKSLLNGVKVFPHPWRVHYSASFGGKKIYFDFRSTGDFYYDTGWCKSILANKVVYHGFFVPSDIDHKYSLLYHALIHKRHIASDYVTLLQSYFAMDDKSHSRVTSDVINCLPYLDDFMSENGYCYSLPKDISVYYNWRMHRLFSKFSFVSLILRGLFLLSAFLKKLYKRTLLVLTR